MIEINFSITFFNGRIHVSDYISNNSRNGEAKEKARKYKFEESEEPKMI